MNCHTLLLPLPTIQKEVDIADTPWCEVTVDPSTSLRYCMLISSPSCNTPYLSNPVFLMFTVVINADHTWQCFAGSKAVDVDIALSNINIATIETASDVQDILYALQCYKICPGHPEEKFVSIVLSKKGTIKSRKYSEMSSFLDSSLPVLHNGQVFPSTVRSSECAIVIPVSALKCTNCIKYHTVLHSIYSNYIKPKDTEAAIEDSSHVNLRFMTTPQ